MVQLSKHQTKRKIIDHHTILNCLNITDIRSNCKRFFVIIEYFLDQDLVDIKSFINVELCVNKTLKI